MNKYILNLAIADLLYCTVNLPVLALQYLYHGWYRNKELCLFFGSFLVVITYAEWMFVAIIALKKCVHLIKPRLGDLIFSGVTGSMILVLIWIYPVLVVANLHFKVSSFSKAEKILKGRLDLILSPSPSLKIMGGKFT